MTFALFIFQVSQYTFAMCSYREKKADPHEMMQLDGFTVDYTDALTGRSHAPVMGVKALAIYLHGVSLCRCSKDRFMILYSDIIILCFLYSLFILDPVYFSILGACLRAQRFWKGIP